MTNDEILELYDREVRIESNWLGRRREATPQIVRQIDTTGARVSNISYAHLDGDNVDKTIDDQIASFNRLGHRLGWLVFDHDTPADLKDRLIARGFEASETEALLVLDVEVPPAALLKPVTADVRRITHPKDVRIVQSLHEEVWNDDYSSQTRQIAEALRHAPDRLSVYVVYADGIPVSCARASWPTTIHFAYLYGGCTLPAYRKRGFYSALVATRLQEARRRRVLFLAVDARPMSRPILEKLGFRFLGCSYRLWK